MMTPEEYKENFSPEMLGQHLAHLILNEVASEYGQLSGCYHFLSSERKLTNYIDEAKTYLEGLGWRLYKFDLETRYTYSHYIHYDLRMPE